MFDVLTIGNPADVTEPVRQYRRRIIVARVPSDHDRRRPVRESERFAEQVVERPLPPDVASIVGHQRLELVDVQHTRAPPTRLVDSGRDDRLRAATAVGQHRRSEQLHEFGFQPNGQCVHDHRNRDTGWTMQQDRRRRARLAALRGSAPNDVKQTADDPVQSRQVSCQVDVEQVIGVVDPRHHHVVGPHISSTIGREHPRRRTSVPATYDTDPRVPPQCIDRHRDTRRSAVRPHRTHLL
ncbi:MAG TPA: hypothetical protein VFZ70_16060 [Euzebyales bacterium]